MFFSCPDIQNCKKKKKLCSTNNLEQILTNNFVFTWSNYSPSQKNKAITRKRDESTFNTEKMMRYDDFTDEDVGNIVMDAEPLPEGCRIFQLHPVVA